MMMMIESSPNIDGYHDTVTVVTDKVGKAPFVKEWSYFGVPASIVKQCKILNEKGWCGAVYDRLVNYRVAPPAKDKAITITDAFDQETLEEIKRGITLKGEHQVAIDSKLYIVTTLEHLEGLS
tara:strand:- start:5712 stop:6080 length:369 start_codon:yes stop_codon:yes gene_type:complete